ncbi:exonuclease domain-containing protein [Mycobacterium sp. SMC-11]|uniref:exonuclease domain-containing protein n=1 Tax=Mycobacterium sp. SMC-11 TaxID=3385969 RepID=UPI00390C6B57
MSFAVIDFETTGFVPERADRVVEVGIVLTDGQGVIEDEWTTLINPRRDVGASHIHGITAGDLLDAPEFGDISGHVLDMLSGRTVVAHNATFDMRFLLCELQRANYAIVDRPAALCSMKWAGRILGAAKLAHCCEAFGIALPEAHSALCDARATAQLMPRLMASCCDSVDWHEDIKRCAAYTWPAPSAPTRHVAAVLRGQASTDPHEWLRTVLQASWISGVPEDEAAYLLVLESALLDREVSRTEARQLVDTAAAAGLGRGTLERLHRDYLRSIAREALVDGVVTAAERDDLTCVAAAVGLTDHDVAEALEWAAANSAEAKRSRFALRTGDRVVFTGDMTCSRDEWIAAIVAAGLTSGGVTKSTRLVVAADPDSLSGKAVKARAYGIPVVGEDAFERMFAQYKAGVATA